MFILRKNNLKLNLARFYSSEKYLKLNMADNYMQSVLRTILYKKFKSNSCFYAAEK